MYLYDNKSARQKMSAAALERAKYFNRRRFFNDFCDTIDGFIAQNDNLE